MSCYIVLYDIFNYVVLCYTILCFVMLIYFVYTIMRCTHILQAARGRFEQHPASKDRTHMDSLRTRHKDVVFATGGAAPPPAPSRNPAAFVLKRAGLLSRTSHHEQDLHQTGSCLKACQRHSVCKRGCVTVLYYIML